MKAPTYLGSTMPSVRSMSCDDCGAKPCEACQRGMAAGLEIREIDVIRFMAHGLSDAEISSRMSCCATTTANRVQSICYKLAVRNNVEIVGWAIGHGVVPYNATTAIFKEVGRPVALMFRAKARRA